MASNTPTALENTPLLLEDSQAEPAAVPGAKNRRQYPRVRPDDATNPLTAGLPGGVSVNLLDLSRGGAQFECDRRLNPNATVSLRLVARDETIVVSARVVRSRLIKLQSGGLGYVVAASFNEPLKPKFSQDEPNAAAAADPDPLPSAHAPAPPGAVSYVEPELPASAFAGISDADARAFEAARLDDAGAVTMTATVATPSGRLLDALVRNDW